MHSRHTNRVAQFLHFPAFVPNINIRSIRCTVNTFVSQSEIVQSVSLQHLMWNSCTSFGLSLTSLLFSTGMGRSPCALSQCSIKLHGGHICPGRDSQLWRSREACHHSDRTERIRACSSYDCKGARAGSEKRFVKSRSGKLHLNSWKQMR